MAFFRSSRLHPAVKPGYTYGRLLCKRLHSDGLTMLAGILPMSRCYRWSL